MNEIIYEGIKFTEPNFINCSINRTKTYRAIKEGTIIKKSCEICGTKAEIHHEDYENYTSIRWLCRSHHIKIHRIFRRLNPDAFDKSNYFIGIIDRVLNSNAL